MQLIIKKTQYRNVPVPALVDPNPITVLILIILGLSVTFLAANIAALREREREREQCQIQGILEKSNIEQFKQSGTSILAA